MTEEPDNLILKWLRELRAEQGATRGDIRDLRDQMKRSSKDIYDRQESIATASGFAMHANLRGQNLETEIDELKQRVERLEQAQ